MKKLINIAFVAAIAAGAGTLAGCSDFLDAENKTNIDSDSYFPTEEGLEGLRTYTYSTFTSAAPTFIAVCTVKTSAS